MVDNRTRYEGIDGLKAYAIIGIALMHVLANGEYGIGGFVFERLIPSFTNLVFLFIAEYTYLQLLWLSTLSDTITNMC